MSARQGPPTVRMEKIIPKKKPNTIELSPDGLSAKQNEGSSREGQSLRANVKVSSGKWYFEVTVLADEGHVRIGWCTASFLTSNSEEVLGQDAYSWAFDCHHHQRVHSHNSYEYGGRKSWKAGDCVGMALDMDEKKMGFYRNGRHLGTAFPNFSANDGLFPAATLFKDGQCKFNFGQTPFQNPPEGGFSALHYPNDHPDYSKLNAIFNTYKGVGIKLSESGDTGDLIKGHGFLQYGQALGVIEDTDPGLLLLAFKLNARRQWEFDHQEFINGWSSCGCFSVEEMKKQLDEWRDEIKDRKHFRDFYFFVFDYLKEQNKVILMTDEALTTWDMLDFPKRWQFWSKWIVFLQNHASAKSISRDAWRQFLEFTQTHPNDFDSYQEDGAWPMLFDDFVEWIKSN